MIKITQIKKLKTKYDVTFNDDEVISIEPVIYLKYHLKLFQLFNQEEYLNIINDNTYEIYKRIGLNRLKKLQTKKELYDHLIEKGSPIGVAKQLIFEFENKKYLDDYTYTKYYVSLNQEQKGPKFLKEILIKKGVSLAIIDGFISKIDEQPIITNLVSKKIKLAPSKKSKNQVKQKIKLDLLRLGFSQELIDQEIDKQSSKINEVSIDVVSNAYHSLLKKVKVDTLDYQEKQKIMMKLYRKGYPLHLIKEVMEK